MKLSLENKKRGAYVLGAVLAAVFAYLVYLPVDHFDEGQSICLSVLLLDKKCYACGMTRAIHHLIHLDFKGAYEYHKLSFVVLPLAAYMISTSLLKVIRQKEETES